MQLCNLVLKMQSINVDCYDHYYYYYLIFLLKEEGAEVEVSEMTCSSLHSQ